MFSNCNAMTPADIAAIANNDGFGNGGGMYLWLLVIIILFGGFGGRNGFWGGNCSTTNSGISDGYILTSDFANIERKIDGVNNGLASLGYDQLSQMNGINQNVTNVGANIMNSMNQKTITDMQTANSIGGQITALGNQMASCCCNQRYDMSTQFANLGYNLADQSCQTRRAISDASIAITSNQDANTRSILSAIQDMQTQNLQDKIATLTADNQALKFAASQQAQNAYLVNALNPYPTPSYIVANPHVGTVCGCMTS